MSEHTTTEEKIKEEKKLGERGRFRKSSHFVTINYKPIHSSSLSCAAKALWVYGCSRPPGWTFYFSEMLSHFKEGKKVIYRALNELIKARLCARFPFRVQQPNSKRWVFGGNETFFYDEPQSDEQIQEDLEELKKSLPQLRFGHPQIERPQNEPLLNKKESKKEKRLIHTPPPDGDDEDPPSPSLSDAKKPKPTPPSPFRTVCRHERVAHLPAHEDFQKHFNQPLIATSNEEHQKLVTKHGEEKVKRAYEYLAEWKISKASSEPKKVLTHTDYFRLTKWVMKEILDSMPGGSRSFQRRGKLAISADERAKSEQHVYEDASVMTDEEKARAKAAYEKMRKDAQARIQGKT